MIYTLFRLIYSFFFCLILPIAIVHKLIMSKKYKNHRRRFLERCGYTPFNLKESIWIHSVSLGESIAVAPLVKKLSKAYPDEIFVITTMTQTGSTQVQKLYKNYRNIKHSYIPYDIPCFLQCFFGRVSPKLCVIMETEIWPNLIIKCNKKNIPVILINARLSQRSANRYTKINFFIHHIFKQIHHVSAQSSDDARRFVELGVPEKKISIDGNIKYDFSVTKNILEDAKKLRHFLSKKHVWIAASTHRGEEEILLKAHSMLLKMIPNVFLILVPRHPERFGEVSKLIKTNGFSYSLKSSGKYEYENDVYLGDTVGEMMLLYAVSDVAFVGGSLVNNGGHNLLEPAALKKPLLSGPSVFNFSSITEKLLLGHALNIVNDSTELAHCLYNLFNNSENTEMKGNAAVKVFYQNKGALNKQFLLIKELYANKVCKNKK